jgi:pantoate--beta-alanine ligase
LVLSRSLQQLKAAVEAGEQDARKLAEIGTKVINAEPGARLDYFAIVNADTLEPVSTVSRGTLIAVAAWVGATRLIDNMVV